MSKEKRMAGSYEGDGHGREQKIPQAAAEVVAGGNIVSRHEPPQHQPEHIGQQDARHKGRDGHEHLVHGGHGPVQPPSGVAGGENAQGDGKGQDQHKGHPRHRRDPRPCPPEYPGRPSSWPPASHIRRYTGTPAW